MNCSISKSFLKNSPVSLLSFLCALQPACHTFEQGCVWHFRIQHQGHPILAEIDSFLSLYVGHGFDGARGRGCGILKCPLKGAGRKQPMVPLLSLHGVLPCMQRASMHQNAVEWRGGVAVVEWGGMSGVSKPANAATIERRVQQAERLRTLNPTLWNCFNMYILQVYIVVPNIQQLDVSENHQYGFYRHTLMKGVFAPIPKFWH